MTAEEFLRGPEQTDRKIERILETIADLRSRAAKMTSVLAGAPGGHSPERRTIEDITAKVCELEEEYAALQREYMQRKAAVTAVLNSLDGTSARILTERYLKHKSWDAVSANMELSISYINHTAKRALKTVEEILRADTAAEKSR